MTSEEFRQIRIRLGLTQAELAALLGTYAQHISRIESGSRQPTRLQAAFLRYIAATRGKGERRSTSVKSAQSDAYIRRFKSGIDIDAEVAAIMTKIRRGKK